MNRARTISLCGIFAALTAASAFFRIPLGGSSITLQVAIVLLSGVVLGSARGALSQAAYVFLGLVGAPVFTRGGGFGYVMYAEFGYLLGFIAMAWVCGFISERGELTIARALIACAAGIAALYAVALPYIAILLSFTTGAPEFGRLMSLYCLAFLPLDALKGVGAAFLGVTLRKRLPLLRG